MADDTPPSQSQPSTSPPPQGAHSQWQQQPETGAPDAVDGPGVANLPATLFAIQLLALLADEDDEDGAFAGVDRVQTLRWLRRLQREDGSFGEVLRQMPPGAGYAYCAIAALSLLDRPLENSTAAHPSQILHSGIRNMPGLIHWLTSRQFAYLEPLPPQDASPFLSDDDDDDDEEVNFLLPAHLSDLSLPKTAATSPATAAATRSPTRATRGGSATELLDWPAARRFLLEKMAHRIGGFSKHPGGPPDVYHGCFGLTALAVMGEPGLNELDSALAVPVRTVRVIEKARRALVERVGRRGKVGGEAVEMGLAMRGEAGVVEGCGL
ncbi:geranylgeranyl transferase type-1 subunit beta [Collariella sp. IMI 366227]|nr:geranylgeranyl transferase type-1 subunit beta [Collariella sp. IMI 366227]